MSTPVKDVMPPKDSRYYRAVLMRQFRTQARKQGMTDAQAGQLLVKMAIQQGFTSQDKRPIRGTELYRYAAPSKRAWVSTWVLRSALFYLEDLKVDAVTEDEEYAREYVQSL